MQPASILTHQQRARQRLQGLVVRCWHREHGIHQPDIQALLALVEDEQMTVRDAHERLTSLELATRCGGSVAA